MQQQGKARPAPIALAHPPRLPRTAHSCCCLDGALPAAGRDASAAEASASACMAQTMAMSKVKGMVGKNEKKNMKKWLIGRCNASCRLRHICCRGERVGLRILKMKKWLIGGATPAAGCARSAAEASVLACVPKTRRVEGVSEIDGWCCSNLDCGERAE